MATAYVEASSAVVPGHILLQDSSRLQLGCRPYRSAYYYVYYTFTTTPSFASTVTTVTTVTVTDVMVIVGFVGCD